MVKGIPRLPEGAPGQTGAGGDRHGDAAIALCMAHAASRAEVAEYGYRAVPSARRAPAARSGRDFMRPDHSGDIRPPVSGRNGGYGRLRRGAL